MTLPQIEETTQFLQQQTNGFVPQVGIILGTGLGSLVNDMEVEYQIAYEDIPHFPVSTVESHKGRLLFGTLSNKKVICMQGRFHYYEGYTMQQVTFPVRVMKMLGIKCLIVSNAAGGLNPDYQISDLMIIEDHISLFLPENPLRGKNLDTLGDRFPDMSEVYDSAMIEKALAIAKKNKIAIHKGAYVSVTGPQLETKAEYRMLRQLGADAVGMSTVPEVMVARHMELPVFGISVITDKCVPETLEKAELSKILAAAYKAEPNLGRIIKELIGITLSILLFFSVSLYGQNPTKPAKKEEKTVSSSSQSPLKEKLSTSSLFDAGEPNTYFAYLTLVGHDLKVGDEIDGVNAENKRVSFKITKIAAESDNPSILKKGQKGSIDIRITKGNINDLGGDFYLVDKGAAYPNESGNQAQNIETKKDKTQVSASLDGKQWNAEVVYQGALFYEKGLSMMDKSGKPFLQLAFKATQAPDDRQLTVQIRNFSPKEGKIDPKQTEVLLSGSANGDKKNPTLQGFKDSPENNGYIFELNIVSWKRVSPQKALLTANFSAKLKGVLGAKDISVTNGKIDTLEVTIFTEKQ